MLWRRPDGDLVRDVPPTKAIMPYLMRGRNESAFYFEQQIAMRQADRYVREFNDAYPDTPITIQHLVMWTITQVLDKFPTMNRFVVGGRLYQRRGIWFTYAAKQSLKEKSPLIVLKRRFDPDQPFVDMVREMHEQLREDRYGGGISASDAEAALILKFPGLIRRVILAVGRFARDLGRPRLEPPVERQEPHCRRQHLLLDHVGAGEQVGECHPMTVPSQPAPAV